MLRDEWTPSVWTGLSFFHFHLSDTTGAAARMYETGGGQGGEMRNRC